MRYALLNLLACPMCKHFPLELYVFEFAKDNRKYAVSKPFCDYYCAYLKKYIKDLGEDHPPCDECIAQEIKSGILVCPSCGRWYPIINGIPLMYPDDKRRHPRVRAKENEFLAKFGSMFPENVRKELPSESSPSPSESPGE